MAKPNRKKLNEKYMKMDDGWKQGAPDAKFMNITQEQLSGKKTVIDGKEAERDDLAAQLRLIEDELDDLYEDLDETMVNVGNGVRGDVNYGDDSPLYGAMGFVRKSERKSGLTKKKKTAKS